MAEVLVGGSRMDREELDLDLNLQGLDLEIAELERLHAMYLEMEGRHQEETLPSVGLFVRMAVRVGLAGRSA
jgi:hypothetical protein